MIMSRRRSWWVGERACCAHWRGEIFVDFWSEEKPPLSRYMRGWKVDIKTENEIRPKVMDCIHLAQCTA
jgi:hypothetical protein